VKAAQAAAGVGGIGDVGGVLSVLEQWRGSPQAAASLSLAPGWFVCVMMCDVV
jgi:hypothetical protein